MWDETGLRCSLLMKNTTLSVQTTPRTKNTHFFLFLNWIFYLLFVVTLIVLILRSHIYCTAVRSSNNYPARLKPCSFLKNRTFCTDKCSPNTWFWRSNLGIEQTFMICSSKYNRKMYRAVSPKPRLFCFVLIAVFHRLRTNSSRPGTRKTVVIFPASQAMFHREGG